MRVPTLRCPPTFGPITQGHIGCVAGPRLHYSGPHYPPAYAGPRLRCVFVVVQGLLAWFASLWATLRHTYAGRVPSCVMLAVSWTPPARVSVSEMLGLPACACVVPSLPYDAPVVCDGMRHRVARRHHMQASPLRRTVRRYAPCRARSAGWVVVVARLPRVPCGISQGRSAPGAALR